MKYPKKLEKGDQVAIVCPASSLFEKIDLEYIKTVLESWGLEVLLGDTTHATHHNFAGNDFERKMDLQKYLDNPDVKAIFAARGGYGCVRIIDQLDFSTFNKNPKWIIGFSDITVLHSHIHATSGIPTLHGQMPVCFETGSSESLESLKNALFGHPVRISYTSQAVLSRPGKAEGILVGGNLSLLHSLLGSDSDYNYDGKILFIEDVGEKYYNIDRMLWTLKRAKKFEKLNGLIVGGFTEMIDTDPSFGASTEEIIYRKVKDLPYPVAFDFPAGHIDDNRAIILGATCLLEINQRQVTLEQYQ